VHPTSTPVPPVDTSPERLRGLWRWNVGLTGLHAVQAVLILVLSGSFAISITSTFPTGPPGSRLSDPQPLFDLPIGIAVAVFLALAALDHLLSTRSAHR
jgi:hypothetical protein